MYTHDPDLLLAQGVCQLEGLTAIEGLHHVHAGLFKPLQVQLLLVLLQDTFTCQADSRVIFSDGAVVTTTTTTTPNPI